MFQCNGVSFEAACCSWGLLVVEGGGVKKGSNRHEKFGGGFGDQRNLGVGGFTGVKGLARKDQLSVLPGPIENHILSKSADGPNKEGKFPKSREVVANRAGNA